MSLSPRGRARNRSSRGDRLASPCLPRAGWLGIPRTGSTASQGKGAVAAGRACSQGKSCGCKSAHSPQDRSLCPLTSPLHPFPHGTHSQALPFMFVYKKDRLSSFRSAPSCPHAARLNGDTPAILPMPPKAAWVREDGKPMQKANSLKPPWSTAQKQHFVRYCRDGSQKMFETRQEPSCSTKHITY